MLHNLPSSPFPSAEPPKPIDDRRLQREQATLMELLNSGAFQWFIEECIVNRKDEQQQIVNDTATRKPQRTIAVHLRAELETLQHWAQRRLEANRAALAQKIDETPETR